MINLVEKEGFCKMDKLVFIQNGTVPVTSSRLVAEYFGKRHDHVLRDIGNIIADFVEYQPLKLLDKG